MQTRVRGNALRLILAAYVGLSLLYNAATPPMEASDEPLHFAYVFYLHYHQFRLPLADADAAGVVGQEVAQPPLYYLAGALLTLPIDMTNMWDFRHWKVDHAGWRADIAGPKNVFQPLGDRSFPYRRTMLAIKVLRLFSMLLGVATIALVFETALLILPDRVDTASLAASLVAFNPMFLFISSSVNNDNAVMVACSAVAYLGIRLGREGMLPRRACVLGMLCGAAVLTKLSGLVALPFLIALWGFTPGSWRERARASLIAVIGFLLVAGPWFAWNIHITGDPTATRLHRELAGNARPQVDPLAIAREWDGCFKSYWGVFGAFNVIYPDAVYYGLMGFSGLCVALYLSHLLRRRLRVEPALQALTVMVLVNLAALVVWTSVLWGSQGRLLFPSIAAISILSAVGITSVHPGTAWPLTVAIILALAVLAFSGGAWVIPAQYPI